MINRSHLDVLGSFNLITPLTSLSFVTLSSSKYSNSSLLDFLTTDLIFYRVLGSKISLGPESPF